MMEIRPARLLPVLVVTCSVLVRIMADPQASLVEVGTHGERIIEWIRSKGGYVNPKIEIRRALAEVPDAPFGMFTKEKLASKEKLFEIPRSCLITNAKDEDWDDDDDEDTGGDAMNCRTVQNLITEMKLDDRSEYAPFVNYINALPKSHLASSWSEDGKALLHRILEDFTEEPLPPADPTNWIEDDWYGVCDGSTDPFEENAALLVVQRSWDAILIPLYDMMNHRNGYHLNTESNSVHEDVKSVKVRTTRAVSAGEELYGSYNMCKDCGNRLTNYGTPEILRDYGFVEQFAQRWIFDDVSFEVDKGSGGFSVKWLDGIPDFNGVRFLFKTQEALQKAAVDLAGTSHAKVPKNELTTIVEYHKAMTVAVSLALRAAFTEEEEKCSAGESAAGTCAVSSKRYESLMEDSDEFPHDYAVCDNAHFYYFEGYDWIDEVQTAYQLLNFAYNPTNNDMCLQLEDIVQICGSYRPHYHEMVVHYTARYVEKVKRVLFVGGGDSMLLHEILKYPDLELVVGLELDQQVTRYAFKHFGSQPHWDNDKVEWWYGNACKSLLMLPKDYFGSFDMVLVDLSETVMSFKVTSELDIMQALALLLTPEGIMVKNEQYFPDMSDIFVNAGQIHYYDVPVICGQHLIFGSNGVSFMQKPLTDHGIDSLNLMIKPLDDEEHNGIIHDYHYDPENIQQHCKQKNDTLGKEELTEQEVSPGIIMLTEAEGASMASQPTDAVTARIVGALSGEGLTVLSTVLPEAKNADATVVVVLKEGYVVGRIRPEHNYVAFDIHLWSSFDKHRKVRDALITAVGSSSESSSSYRVVAGGMFGVETWKEDTKSRGPHRTLPCDIAKLASDSAMDNLAFNAILEESVSQISQEDSILVVVCGPKTERCHSFDELHSNTDYSEVQFLYSCDGLVGDSADSMYACELELTKTLKVATEEKKIRTIVVDPSMGYPMGQIIFTLFGLPTNRITMLEDVMTVIAMAPDKSDAHWRRILINEFRKEIFEKEPVFRGQVVFRGTDDVDVELNIVSEDEWFVTNFKTIISNVESRTGLASEIQNVNGGQKIVSPDYEFSQNFLASDYDQVHNLAQWTAQVPLEQQTIFQLEDNNEDEKASSAKLSADMVKSATEEALTLIPGGTQIDDFTNLGEGCLLVALWTGGRVIVLWDGTNHVDINITTNAVNESVAEKFKNKFLTVIPSMTVVLQDVQPRGVGRVVNLLKDTKLATPHWA